MGNFVSKFPVECDDARNTASPLGESELSEMNHHDPNNQISAWFDDELTAAERANAKLRLEQSLDARDELTEIGNISEWLGELPCDSLPDDFAAGVEKRTARPVAKPASTAHGSAQHPRWSQGFGIVLSVAAVLFLTVTLFFGPKWAGESPQRWPVATTEDAGGRDLTADNGDRFFEMQAPTEEAIVGFRGKNEFENESHGIAGDSAKSSPTERFFDEGSPERFGKSATEKSTIASRGRTGDAPAGGLTFSDNLRRAEIGQIVEALERSAGQISVVRLTVVDRREGLKYLQVLLSRNHIPQELTADAGQQQENSRDAVDAESALPKPDGRLVAVYVEATGPQLAAVFEQIERESKFQPMKIDSPITIAQLAQATPAQLAFGGRANRRLRSGFNAAKSPRADGAKDDTSRKSLPRRATAESAPKAVLDGKPANGKELKKVNSKEGRIVLERRQRLAELDRISRQLELSLAPAILRSKKRGQEPSGARPLVESLEKQKKQLGANAPEAKAADRSITSNSRLKGTPLQVLFVLEIVPPGEKVRPIQGRPAGSPPAPTKKKASVRKPNGAA